MKIYKVAYNRNGSAGAGFHVVTFALGRGSHKHLMVGIVHAERHNIAVLEIAGLTNSDENSWDGPFYEDELRDAVLRYESERADSVLEESEVLDLTYGKHACLSSSGVCCIPEGKCVVCGRPVEVIEKGDQGRDYTIDREM